MQGKVILIVEDNEDELTIYATVLGYHGYTVLTASDFDTALELARTRRPDLAIVDINLGDGRRDGCDLTAAFREADETATMPVIAHTAFGDVYRRRLDSTGCETILHKPSNPARLLDTVRGLIGETPLA